MKPRPTFVVKFKGLKMKVLKLFMRYMFMQFVECLQLLVNRQLLKVIQTLLPKSGLQPSVKRIPKPPVSNTRCSLFKKDPL